MSLKFNETDFEVQKITEEGRTVVCRTFEHIPYCEFPKVPDLERLSIYVPEIFYQGGSINGYDLHSAPIFMPNTIGGYMPGPEEAPGKNFMGKTNASFYALLNGYVVVSAGARGRGNRNAEGENVGVAPAGIVDLKAAVRFLRHNKELIPGNTDRIITNGTSAGGAMSSLLGTTGNHPDYEPYLKEIGAADERDDVFASSCYCPITNLDHADVAYEWEFCGLNDYHRAIIAEPLEGEPSDHPAIDKRPGVDGNGGMMKPPKFIPENGEMTRKQQALSVELCSRFPGYLNMLNLSDENGQSMTLNDDGTGTFLNHVIGNILKSAQKELDAGRNIMSDSKAADWLRVENGSAVSVDWKEYVKFRTRMKEAPAFDNVSMGTAENELFGTVDVKQRHFTAFSKEHDTVGGAIAEKDQVRLMNPMYYIDDPIAVKATHFRIRHGAVDRDTSLAISEILALKLMGAGIDTDIAHPWGIPHAGDYDLPELFDWIDSICK